MILDTEDWRRGLRKEDFVTGLVEVAEERLFHVAEAGSFGGGILSYLERSMSASDERLAFELLRRRATFNRSFRVEAGTTVVLSGSDGVEIWLSLSAGGAKMALCV